MSANEKSGNVSLTSCSFSTRMIQAMFPVERRMCTSAQCVHQQLQSDALKIDVSLVRARRPVRQRARNNSDVTALKIATAHSFLLLTEQKVVDGLYAAGARLQLSLAAVTSQVLDAVQTLAGDAH